MGEGRQVKSEGDGEERAALAHTRSHPCASLPSPHLFFAASVPRSESHSCAGVRARCGASLHRHGGRTITEPGIGKGGKGREVAQRGKTGKSVVEKHLNLWKTTDRSQTLGNKHTNAAEISSDVFGQHGGEK